MQIGLDGPQPAFSGLSESELAFQHREVREYVNGETLQRWRDNEPMLLVEGWRKKVTLTGHCPSEIVALFDRVPTKFEMNRILTWYENQQVMHLFFLILSKTSFRDISLLMECLKRW